MKKLYKLSVLYFWGPFIATFFISLFVLLMQFLWKYVDDMVGKGLEWYVILELLFYASAHLVPLALPLSILVSSIMTMGNLAEYNELMALKSAGVSLLKVLKALGIIILFIAFGAFLFANYTLPRANLEFGALLWDIKEKKPTFDIYEGVFYSEIDGYSIRIGHKDDKTNMIEDILIYDHTESSSNNIVIKAESGEMHSAEGSKWLIIKLFDGYRYEEIRNLRNSYRTFPQSRIKFKEYEMRFDLSSFNFSRTSTVFFKDNKNMLKMGELDYATDSIEVRMNELRGKTRELLKSYFYFLRDSSISAYEPRETGFTNDTFIYNFPARDRKKILNIANSRSMSVKNLIENVKIELDNHYHHFVRYNIEWHRKITLSFSVLIVFLLGAPMGAIIRKGGLGMPTVVSIFLFIGYYIVFIIGEKLTKQYVLTPLQGMWLPIVVLLPVGIFLVHKANTDSMLFNKETYLRYISYLSNIVRKKKTLQ